MATLSLIALVLFGSAVLIVDSRPPRVNTLEDDDVLDSDLETVVLSRTRRHMSSKHAKAAQNHYGFVHRNYGCQTPLPRVVNVKEFYPSTSKEYSPACTVLHRCSKDTGCCNTQEEICGPKSTEEVRLFFNVVEIKPDGDIAHRVTSLTFSNHTECECKLLNDFPR